MPGTPWKYVVKMWPASQRGTFTEFHKTFMGEEIKDDNLCGHQENRQTSKMRAVRVLRGEGSASASAAPAAPAAPGSASGSAAPAAPGDEAMPSAEDDAMPKADDEGLPDFGADDDEDKEYCKP